MKSYSVNPIGPQQELIRADADAWATAQRLSDFSYPWENEVAPPLTFRALHDSEWLYVRFEVEDDPPLVHVSVNAKAEVLQSDRVEIFFRPNEKMDTYYCLEVDPLARVYDYRAAYHRQFDPQWSWPHEQLRVRSSQTENGYVVVMGISKQSLRELGLLRNRQLQVGLFRGKCVSVGPDESKKMKWISWVKPDAPTPDFHLPAAFGIFSLEA